MLNYAADCQNRFPSLWSATTTEDDLSVVMPDGEERYDVVIVGAGYTGLSTAIELQRHGLRCCVIDGGFPGWGGSGRNSGAVIRGFKNSRSQLIREFGQEQGQAMSDFGGSVTARVLGLIDEFSIRCDLVRSGWILPAHNRPGLKRVEDRVRAWSEDGFPGLSMLSREQISAMLGSDHYIGGMIDAEGASLNPLSYARGLARAAISLGATVYRQTPATAVTREGSGWKVTTPQGLLRGDRVLMATNAYTAGAESTIRRSLATIHTNIIATRPLPPQIANRILPELQAVSDIRRILFYWHKDAHDRILFGTRGTLKGPSGTADFDHVQRAMLSVYPQLKDQPIEFRWSGRVGLTQDFVPHINEPQPGLWTAYGYCGRGVAMATSFGQLLGKTLASGKSFHDLPVPRGPAPTMPPEPFRGWGVAMVTQAYRLLDTLN